MPAICAWPRSPTGEWVTHGWIQQAISLYFRLRVSETIEVGPFEFLDKIPLKRNLEARARARGAAGHGALRLRSSSPA